MRVLSIVALLALMAVGCDTESYVYYRQQPIPTDTWRYGDSLVWDFEVEDTTRVYTLLLDVAHRTDYPYQNLYYRAYTTYPDGTRLDQVINTDLLDGAGRYYGRCDDEACDLRVVLQQRARFPQVGQYRFGVEQYTRTDALSGVQSLAFGLQVVDELE